MLNGQKLTAAQEDIEVVKQVRAEGRLLRRASVTLDPDFSESRLNELDGWPEAVCFFYLWTGVEAWIAHTMSTHVLKKAPRYPSLHFDGMNVDSWVRAATPTLLDDCEEVIRAATGCDVKLLVKPRLLKPCLYCGTHLVRNRGEDAVFVSHSVSECPVLLLLQ